MKDDATLDDCEIYINLNRKDIHKKTFIIQEEILIFLDDVRTLYQTTAA